MSHISKLKTSVTNAQALVRALKRMGIQDSQIEVHEKAIQCHGYHEEEKYMANVIVRRSARAKRESFGSDIGWERTENGTFVAHTDDYDYSRVGQHYSAEWQKRLGTYYNVEAAKMELEANGIEYTESENEKRLPQIEARFKVNDDNNRFRNRG